MEKTFTFACLAKKKALCLVLAAVSGVTFLNAVPANPNPFIYSQPDDTTQKVKLHCMGDEYCHWIETADHEVVVKDSKGVYKYATIKNEKIVPSNIRVGDKSKKKKFAKKTERHSTREEILGLLSKQYQKNMIGFNARVQEEKQDTLKFQKRVAVQPLNIKALKKTSKDGLKVLCVLIEFEDRHFVKSNYDFYRMWNEENYSEEGSCGSVSDYYLENSYGKLNVSAHVVGPYVVNRKSSDYVDPGALSARKLVRAALCYAVKVGDVNLKDFDGDHDGYVDAVHFVIAGYAYEDSDARRNGTGQIWSHQSEFASPVTQKGSDVKAEKYFITSELAGGSGSAIAPIGTICHEFGHVLGVPDFYDTDANTEGKEYFCGTGYWDVMCNGSWSFNGRCPTHHNPYTKAYIFKWVTPKIIKSNSSNVSYTLKPSSTSAQSIYRVNTETDGEYFLLENRAGIGFDSNPYIDDKYYGLLIYHIHKDLDKEIKRYGSSANVNKSHPQKCYVVCSNAPQSRPDKRPDSYGCPSYYNTAYPLVNEQIGSQKTRENIYFTSQSIPSAKSWSGEPLSVGLWFIQHSGEHDIKFVVNPEITGSDYLGNTMIQAEYHILDVPASAKVEWTYAYTRENGKLAFQGQYEDEPLCFIDGDTTASVILQCGRINKYTYHPENNNIKTNHHHIGDSPTRPYIIVGASQPIYISSHDLVSFHRFDSVKSIRMIDSTAINRLRNAIDTYSSSPSVEMTPYTLYYKGKILLMAQITNGNDMYNLTKIIDCNLVCECLK